MTNVYKEEKEVPFAGPNRDIEDRDIRAHDFEGENFNIMFTDSSCPFTAILEQVSEPGKDYFFALNDGQRIDRLRIKKWELSDPSLLKSNLKYSIDEKDRNSHLKIINGDTVLMERDMRYSIAEKEYLNNRTIEVTKSALHKRTTDIPNLTTPFKNHGSTTTF